ncbi:hypothetical protein HAX54_007058 [Datura stramonium]|uniref:non-specific serine/threonine protein kinase n=1 Tax=Datura stramonium TaxID=4076 RepID=A0ABS8TCE9_DATST|nr:hypothetical protein [Datura stramonium]
MGCTFCKSTAPGQLGEGGFAYVFLVKEVISDPSNPGVSKKFPDSSHISDDGTYAMKKVLIQNNEQLELVKGEIRVSSLFTHPTCCLLIMLSLQSRLRLISPGSMKLTCCFRYIWMEWAAEHVSAPFRAPELWDCPSQCDIDERTDIWSLGCTLYAIMYGVSPFEYALGESGGSLQLAIVNAQIKWPAGPKPPYPEALHQFVTWMLQPQGTVRPHIDDIIIHVDKLISKFSH